MPAAALRPRWALAGLALAMLLSSLGTSVANVALPTLEDAFGAPFGAVQWVVLSYLLAVTALVVGAGRLGDVAGRRRLLVGGIATFTAASALCAAAPTLWVLVAARGLQGIGAAAMMALTLAFVAEAVPRERSGAAMGLLGSTSAVGTALGPSLGGALIAALGWRAIFLVNVPVGLVALRLAHRHLPGGGVAPVRAGRQRFDFAGTALLALALGAYALAMTAGGPGALAAGLLIAAAAAALLAVAERRAEAPLLAAATLRDRALRAGLVTGGIVAAVMMATLVAGPFHLARTLELGPAPVGLVMSAGPAVVAVSGVPAGRIADRLGPRRVSLAGLAVMAAGAALLALLTARLGVAGYVAPLVVLTIGYALFQTANTTAVMAAAPADARGAVSGMLGLSRNVGLVTGAAVLGAVFARAGMRVTFVVATSLILIAIAESLLGVKGGARAAGRAARRASPRPASGPGPGRA